VTPGGSVDGLLQPGDRILAVNGYAQLAPPGLGRLIALVRPGSCYQLTVSRGKARLEIRLPVPQKRGTLWWGIPAHLLAGIACLIVGMLFGLPKPGERTVQLGCITLLALSAAHLAHAFGVVYWARAIGACLRIVIF
jgi:hypothetical protein